MNKIQFVERILNENLWASNACFNETSAIDESVTYYFLDRISDARSVEC
ncbi:hypothetical protein [Chamaesiphon sp. VAR_69_metabat_338]|nr:hypothetical protein [Chamaesiphon sp. VAR_69_metabat_338]